MIFFVSKRSNQPILIHLFFFPTFAAHRAMGEFIFHGCFTFTSIILFTSTLQDLPHRNLSTSVFLLFVLDYLFFSSSSSFFIINTVLYNYLQTNTEFPSSEFYLTWCWLIDWIWGIL